MSLDDFFSWLAALVEAKDTFWRAVWHLCVHSQRGRWESKGVVLVSLSLHSTRGGLHHRFVTGMMTESESHAGGRTCNRLAAGLQGCKGSGGVSGASARCVHPQQAVTPGIQPGTKCRALLLYRSPSSAQLCTSFCASDVSPSFASP